MRLGNYKKSIALILTAGLLGILLCLSAFCGFGVRVRSAAAEEAKPSRTRVVGYLPDWSYQAYRNIDFTTLTHINISFCNVSGNALACGIPSSEMKNIVDKAHADNVKVMAALGGGGYGDPYRGYISNSSNIASLNEKIVEFCESNNLDGIDLDIEIASGDSIWNNYGNWVSSLRSICDERGWELSTATAQWVAGSVSAETFALFDFVNVMAYDNYENIGTNGTQNSHSSYSFAVNCLNYFHTQKSVPKEKLVLGVPFYGRGYNDDGTTDWDLYVGFSDIVNKNAENYDSDYAYYYDGAVYPVAYTGASTMRDKCGLAKEYGGIMIWEISLDADGEYSLLSLIKAELSPLINEPDPDENHDEEPDPDTKPEDGQERNSDVLLWVSVGVVAGVAFVAVSAGTIVAIVLVKRRKKLK